MMESDKIIERYLRLRKGEEEAVLATIVEIRGSHYAAVGTKSLIIRKSETIGMLGGGCLKEDILARAREVLASGHPTVISLDTTSKDDVLFGSGMGCGGSVKLLLEPTNRKTTLRYIEQLEECRVLRTRSAVATAYDTWGDVGLQTGDRVFLVPHAEPHAETDSVTLTARIHADLSVAIGTASSSNKTYTLQTGGARLFIEYIRPPVSAVIFGAGDDVIPLCNMFAVLEWECTIIDPRADLLTRKRFPGARELIRAHSNDPISYESIDKHDAVVIMTHNYLRDLEILRHLSIFQLPYIGLLGAASRVDKLLAELAKEGRSASERHLRNLYAPVGLDIGANSPEEIALAIVSEIRKVLGGGSGLSLRDKKTHFAEIVSQVPFGESQ